jgi:Putative Ig domain
VKFAIQGLTVLAAATALVAGAAVSTATAAPTSARTTAPTVAGKVAAKPTVAGKVAAKPTVAGKVAAKPTVAGKVSAQAAKAVAHPYVHHKTKRVCSTVRSAHRMTCFAIRQTDTVQPKAFATKAVVPNAVPAGYGPANLASAYKLSSAGGSGATVAIVDAYNDPSAAADLAVYRSQYGLPACTVASGCLRILTQNGATSPLPGNNSGWAQEESLDLDMVSAVCPKCHIILLEANSPNDSDLFTAVDTAVSLGAKYVSNSYGGDESSGQTTDLDPYFNHPGVAITASTGDDGTGAAYPATSRYVTAVGGTSLSTASNTRGWSEAAWSGAGSGCSQYDPKPTWQTVATGSCTKRAEADVSAVADPNTGVAVYLTTGGSGWTVFGGTSAAAPIVASVYALAGTPAAGTYPASYPYSHLGNLFDVTTGNNGSCGAPLCTAGTGWDGPTGLGTPNGTAAFTAGATSTVTVTNPGNKTATVGTAITPFTVTATGGSTYTWTSSGLPPGLVLGSSTGTVSGTPTTAGTYSVTVTATSGTQSGSATFTITVSPAGGGCTGAGQKLANPGFESGNTAWTATTGVIGQYGSSGEPTHAGSWDAWLDGYGTTHTDSVSQSVTIPAGCTNSTLSFYLHIDTSETTTTSQYDKLTVTVGSTTLATYSNLNKATGYAVRSFNVGSFAGQTVAVTFTGTEDNSLPTSFVLDDTALTAG